MTEALRALQRGIMQEKQIARVLPTAHPEMR